jgi:hypothetical protein
MKGAFTTRGHREHENAEPERTERLLLAKPLALFPTTASDAYESVAVTVLYKSRGDRKHALTYHLGRLSVQVRHTPIHVKHIMHAHIHMHMPMAPI